jgi:hypothetical protein
LKGLLDDGINSNILFPIDEFVPLETPSRFILLNCWHFISFHLIHLLFTVNLFTIMVPVFTDWCDDNKCHRWRIWTFFRFHIFSQLHLDSSICSFG